MNRKTWVLVHRYAGLLMAVVLIVAGLTGTLLAFRGEIDAALNPPPSVVRRDAPLLDPLTLRERLLQARPEVAVPAVSLARVEADRAFATWVLGRVPGREGRLPYQVVHQDPYSGEVIGTARPAQGLLPVTRENLMDLVYALHYRLALPGSLGKWLFGLVALIWTLDCFVGAYLTMPARVGGTRQGAASKSWWQRWWPAWRIKLGASTYRFTLDLHRAGSLWLWAMLLVIAWSAVGLNLPGPVYDRAMRLMLGHAPDPVQTPAPPASLLVEPPLPWREALARARAEMDEQASAQGFSVAHEVSLSYQPEQGQFIYTVVSSRDLHDEHGATYLGLDASDGRFLGLKLPTGQHRAATVDHWLKSLHMARVGVTTSQSLAFQAFVALMGLFVAYLSASGVYLWWKKKKARSR